MLNMTEDFLSINGEGTILRKAQLRVLDILIEVDKICRKYNIDYWLMGGTLLGAVRHGGFIPWDDDIDISVKHNDLKKLSKILQQELPEQYVVQNYKTDKNYYLDSVLKIRDTKSIASIEYYKSFQEQGLFLDIVSMEKIPSQKLKRFVFRFNKYPYLRRKEISLKGKSNNIKGFLFAPISKLLIKLAHWFSQKSSTTKIGYNYLFWLGHFFDMEFEKETIFPLKTMKFEGREFFVPNDTDKFLRITYGDFMKIPPPKNRLVHASEIKVYD